MAEINYPTSVDVIVNNTCSGKGTIVNVDKTVGATTYSGEGYSFLNIVDGGTFKINWNGLRKQFSKYWLDDDDIADPTLHFDALNNLEWKITGSEFIMEPTFYYLDASVTPRKYNIIPATLLAQIPGTIFLTVGTILNDVLDMDAVEEDYTMHDLISILLKYMPNTAKDGYFIMFNAESNTNNADYVSAGGPVTIAIYGEKYYTNLYSTLDDTRNGGIDPTSTLIKWDNELLPFGHIGLTCSGTKLYVEGY